jgi:Tol biopolymer transport system component
MVPAPLAAFLALAALALPATAAAQEPEDHVAVVPAAGGPETVLTQEPLNGTGVAALGWSPDGAAVLALTQQLDGRRSVVVRHPADGSAATVTDRLAAPALTAAFSRDGRLAAAPLRTRDVVLRGARPPARVRGRRGEWPVALAWSADGRRVAIAAERPRSAASTITVADGATGRAVRRFRVPGRAEALGWSPDGRRLAYAAGEIVAKVVLLDVATGSRRLVASPRAQQGGGAPAFSPAGLLAVLDYSGVRLGGPAGRIGLRGFVAHGLEWSPDGRSLALALLGGDVRPALAVVDAVDGSAAPRILGRPLSQAVEHLAWSPDGTRIAYAATWPG